VLFDITIGVFLYLTSMIYRYIIDLKGDYTMSTTQTSVVVDFHVPTEVKEVWEVAAELSGHSLIDIIIAATSEKAAEIIDGRGVIRVSEAAMEQLMEALRNPAEPNEFLERGATVYREAIEKGELVV
jgi:uncharacterized protein (DUF1778 family)